MATLDDGDDFCPKCGCKQDEYRTTDYQLPPDTMPQNEAQHMGKLKVEERTPKKRLAWIVVAISAAVLLVIAIICGVFAINSNKYDSVDVFSESRAVVERKGKYGYINESGKEIIPLIYDDAKPFKDGKAIVMKNGKYGYIDTLGTEVIPLKYDDAQEFSEELAVVAVDGKWGYIDGTGKEIIPFIYDDATGFSEGKAAVKKDGKWGFVDKSGKEAMPLESDYADDSKKDEANASINKESLYTDKSDNKERQQETKKPTEVKNNFDIYNGNFQGGGTPMDGGNGQVVYLGRWSATISFATQDSFLFDFSQGESDYYVEKVQMDRQSDGSYKGTALSSWGKSYFTIRLDASDRITVTVSGDADMTGTETLYRYTNSSE